MTEKPEPSRPKAGQILENVLDDARDEIGRSPGGLAFSGLAAGFSLGLSGLGAAAAFAVLGHGTWQTFVAFALYPIGFIAVIVGRGQLFTENTLYPVVLVLDERRHLLATLRLWAIVLAANLAGVALFALLAVKTAAVTPPMQRELVDLGVQSAAPGFGTVFWSGIVGGWLIALVAWLIEGSDSTIGQIVVIWFLTFLVGVGRFAHAVATPGEILAAVAEGQVTVGAWAVWQVAATLGNTVGGVFIVALLNYGQVVSGAGRVSEPR